MRRILVLTGTVFLMPIALAAQDSAKAAPKPARHPVAAAWELHSRRLMSLADSMPADAFTTRWAVGVKSFDELIGHAVETNYGVCAGTRKVDSPKKGQKIEGAVVTKTDLIALLRDSHAYCDSLFTSLVPGTMANSDLTFLPSHSGQMGALMEAYVLARGTTLKNSEAGRAKPAGR
jgi:hypothetical protein